MSSDKTIEDIFDMLRLTRYRLSRRYMDRLSRRIGAASIGEHAFRLDPGDRELFNAEAKRLDYSTGGTLINRFMGIAGERCVRDELDRQRLEYAHLGTIERDSLAQRTLIAEHDMPWNEILKRRPDFKLMLKDGSPGPILEIKTIGFDKGCVTVPVGCDEMGLKGADYLICVRALGPVEDIERFTFLGFMEAPVLCALPLVHGDARNGRTGPFFALSWGDPLDREAQRASNWPFSNRRPQRTGPIFEPLKDIEGLWDILKRDCLQAP